MALVTVVGGVLRAWGLPRLGLTHFDEGIYAMAGTWVLNPRGLAGIDPMLIPYAPPGFPILVGMSYATFGISDLSAILVSVVAGTLTIPVVAWLGRRTFGPCAGVASAIFIAMAGPHIAFSRMAMTDASFLLAWLVAIGMGQRFLERPDFPRAFVLGLAVGMAQQFKYNGWLAGAIVVATAVLGAALSAEERRGERLKRTFGWGMIAAVVAAFVVMPWFLFVDDHGGYSALLRHQRSYLVGIGRWLPSLRTQAIQAVALSGHSAMIPTAAGLAVLAAWLVRLITKERERMSWADLGWVSMVLIAVLILLVMIPNATWWLSLVMVPGLLMSGATRLQSVGASWRTDSPARRHALARRLVGVWWVILSAITPLYHPYARLWLPIHAAGWVILGGLAADGLRSARPFLRRIRGLAEPGDPGMARFSLAWAWGLAVAVACSIDQESARGTPRALPGLWEPTDSVRVAAAQVVAQLPGSITRLRFLGRPCVTFYLAGRVPIEVQADEASFSRKADPATWGLFDGGLGKDWPASLTMNKMPELFMVTDPYLPTLLDLDPRFATDRGLYSASRQKPFLLLDLRQTTRRP